MRRKAICLGLALDAFLWWWAGIVSCALAVVTRARWLAARIAFNDRLLLVGALVGALVVGVWLLAEWDAQAAKRANRENQAEVTADT